MSVQDYLLHQLLFLSTIILLTLHFDNTMPIIIAQRERVKSKSGMFRISKYQCKQLIWVNNKKFTLIELKD